MRPQRGLLKPMSDLLTTDGEHSFKPRQQSGRTLEQNLDAAVAAVTGFVERLSV
jgi:predicted alpha/beta-hydrolase family hydrolase